MTHDDLYQQLASTPYMLSMVERNRHGQEEEGKR